MLGLAIAGCSTTDVAGTSPATPAPAVSTTASPSVAPAAVVSTLRFSGSDVRALDTDDAILAQAGFAAGVDATVRLVADALGVEPVASEYGEGCAGPLTSYEWPGLVVTAWTGSTEFTVSLDAPSIGDVRLETVGGFAPGDDVAAFAATLPATSLGPQGGTDLYLAFDIVSTVTQGEYTSPVGAVGHAGDGVTLDSVLTPGEWSSFFC